MNPERWRQIKALFQEAVELKPERRARFLDRACAGREDLRPEIEALIKSHERAGSFIELPAFAHAPELVYEHAPLLTDGETLGRYRIVRGIGRGGMGEVYLAEDAHLNREVALKLLPASFMEEEDRLRRFEQEASAR